MPGPLGVHVQTFPDSGPHPHMKPCTHMCMGPRVAQAQIMRPRTMGTPVATHTHACTHIHTGPVDQYAPVHTHIHGCLEVHVHRHHSPGSCALVCPSTHSCAFMSTPGDMSTASHAQINGNICIHAHTHAQLRLSGVCVS